MAQQALLIINNGNNKPTRTEIHIGDEVLNLIQQKVYKQTGILIEHQNVEITINVLEKVLLDKRPSISSNSHLDNFEQDRQNRQQIVASDMGDSFLPLITKHEKGKSFANNVPIYRGGEMYDTDIDVSLARSSNEQSSNTQYVGRDGHNNTSQKTSFTSMTLSSSTCTLSSMSANVRKVSDKFRRDTELASLDKDNDLMMAPVADIDVEDYVNDSVSIAVSPRRMFLEDSSSQRAFLADSKNSRISNVDERPNKLPPISHLPSHNMGFVSQQNNYSSQMEHSCSSSMDIDREQETVTSNWKEVLISEPHQNDVLSGRGSTVNSHYGNIHYRALVRHLRPEYVVTPKADKALFSQAIVRTIQYLTPAGRFLMKTDNGFWKELTNKKALDKTRQALREGADKVLQQIRSGEVKVETNIREQTESNILEMQREKMEELHNGKSGTEEVGNAVYKV